MYNIIIKIGGEEFAKYRQVTDLLRFVQFANTRFPQWRYMNVFDHKSKEQVASYTRKNPPTKKTV
jgi:hypothetical protein